MKFSGSSIKIEQADYLSASKTEIEVLVPADVHDGPVTLVSAASQEIVSEDEIVVKVPGNISVSAERFKAGEALTVSGDDLDLVVGLKFADNVDSEFEFVEGSIVTTIPASAKDGTLVLTTAADKSVEPCNRRTSTFEGGGAYDCVNQPQNQIRMEEYNDKQRA